MKIDFSKGSVLVIGDLMLDRYVFGSVGRISPEAPVPIVKANRFHDTLGGSGNVANNLAHLKSKVRLIGPLGKDSNGRLIASLCRKGGILLFPVIDSFSTISKTRVIGDHQQIVRIDSEEKFKFTSETFAHVKKIFSDQIRFAQVVVISDYGKGFCSNALCSFVIRETRMHKKQIIVDPKGRDWTKYTGASIITPNVKELSDVAGDHVDNSDGSIEALGKRIRETFKLKALLVTRSEKGMSLLNKNEVIHVPTDAREVFDVSGAGDTVVATLSASLANGYSIQEAIGLSNKAAGIVVGKVGTVPICVNELQAIFDPDHNSKLFGKKELINRLTELRSQGKRIVFSNGHFDLLHRGHVHLLQQGKKLGDVLIVALNGNTITSRSKTSGRFATLDRDRAHLIAAIEAVDFVTIFNEKTPLSLIKMIRPDIIVKGGNYKQNEVLGREFCGKVAIIPHLKGYSTKEIVMMHAKRLSP